MNIIKKMRIKNNMTQFELAQELGVKISTVSMWEIGENKPTAETIKKMSELFKITTDEIIFNLFNNKTEKIS